jgi:hypothetical protein
VTTPEATSLFERHAQTVIGGIVLLLLAWVGTTLVDVNTKISRMEVLVLSDKAEILDLRERVRRLELHDAQQKGTAR